MEWIPKEEIEAAAKESPLAAIEMSIKHYMQLASAGRKELKEGFRESKVSVGDTYCALCQRYKRCSVCPLALLGTTGSSFSCCEEWKTVNHARGEMYKADYSPATVVAFQAACLNTMLPLLFKCRRAEVAKEELKKEEPQGWEKSVNWGVRISSTTVDITSEGWPVRLSMISNHRPRWWEGRPMGEYGECMGPIPGETFTVKQARAIASAINELCDIIEASETQKEGKR